MKIMIPLLLIASTSLPAQNKSGNSISIQGMTFSEIVQRFIDSGYTFQVADEKRGFLRTFPSSRKLDSGEITFMVDIRDSLATIYAEYKVGDKIRPVDFSGNGIKSPSASMLEYMAIAFGKEFHYVERKN